MTAALLALLTNSAEALAEPIEASGSAVAQAGEAGSARERAIGEARNAALEQALARLDVTVNEAAIAQVRERADAWTGGYRVLDVRELDDRVEVTIEAEIDIPRLRKRVAARSGPSRGQGLAWGELELEGCAGVDPDRVGEPLRAYGIVADGGHSTLSLTLRCRDRGAVSHTHVRAAVVEIVARIEGGVELETRVDSWGFAAQLEAATQIALDRALGELADELAVEARGELELRVEQPWPAQRLSVLESSLREAVLGVDRVELAGITADGAAILRIGGSVDAEALGRALQGLSFPDFGLVGLRIDNAHALRVRMQ